MAKAKAPTSQKNPAWVVTVGAMKGGAGKTMVVDNIAGCLAERYKVLVVDADPQANASKGLGIDIADPDMTTLADVLTNQGTPPEDAVIRAPLRDLPNLDVMPSSILLFKTEFELAAKGERIRLLGYSCRTTASSSAGTTTSSSTPTLGSASLTKTPSSPRTR